MSDKKLPPELQKLMATEATKHCDHDINRDRMSFILGFDCCYQAMQAQAAKGFDEEDTNKEARRSYLRNHTSCDGGDRNYPKGFKHGAHWHNARYFAAMQAKDTRIEELEGVLGMYHEYFEAISGGEYSKNRPAPLRDYEVLMQSKANQLLKGRKP